MNNVNMTLIGIGALLIGGSFLYYTNSDKANAKDKIFLPTVIGSLLLGLGAISVVKNKHDVKTEKKEEQ